MNFSQSSVVFGNIVDWLAIHFLNDVALLQASRCRGAGWVHRRDNHPWCVFGDPEVACDSRREVLHLDAL